jgi:hypothetical protein
MMLKIMISVTNQRVQKWLRNYATSPEKPDVSMTLEFSDLIADSDLAAVFGVRSIQHKLRYSHGGEQMDVTVGKMLKMLGGRYLSRVYHPLRNMFDCFDMMDLNAEEREN